MRSEMKRSRLPMIIGVGGIAAIAAFAAATGEVGGRTTPEPKEISSDNSLLDQVEDYIKRGYRPENN